MEELRRIDTDPQKINSKTFSAYSTHQICLSATRNTWTKKRELPPHYATI